MTLLRQRYVGALLLVKTLYEFNMHEGTVKGGIYGGTNAAAAIQKNANVNIYGGQVGTDTSHTGNVFGGGYGATAVMYGDPHVYIDLINGAHSSSVTNRWSNKLGTIGEVYGGGNAAKVVGDTYVNVGTKSTVLRADGKTNATVLGVNISGNVYGGGNAADVTGKTNVTIGRSPTTTP